MQIKKFKNYKKAREINDYKPLWVLKKIKKEINTFIEEGSIDAKDINICIYGLTFKADVDDIRESPAIKISEEILKTHIGKIYFIDPNLEDVYLNKRKYKISKFNELKDSIHIHVMLVDHNEFKNKKPNHGSIIDTRGIWNE